MAKPAIHALSLWLGDEDPRVIWEFPFSVEGSDFSLSLRFAERLLVYSVSGGGLTLDAETDRVTWDYGAVPFADMPRRRGPYELSRIIAGPGGEKRTYVAGTITLESLINV